MHGLGGGFKVPTHSLARDRIGMSWPKILAADGRTYGLELFCILRYFGNRALAGTQNGPRVEYP